ncbi:hypothetical protein FG386_000720 [Cryptosporidium ryanae]|uniref:uncharacterized protein n=1 Tax=Cryptosporidium ryanae TaxID=515981 RepID=UPI003519FA0B|nr:hypothetical protein FG386_000720 [Cryptosporidium ryanae]
MAHLNNKLISHLNKIGLSLINNDFGLSIVKSIIFDQSLNILPSILSIQPANWSNFIKNTPIRYSILEEVTNIKGEKIEIGKNSILFTIPEDERMKFIIDSIKEICCEIFNLLENPEIDDSLHNIGADSLSAIEFRDSICNKFEITLPNTVLFDYPTVRGLSNYIYQKSFEFNNYGKISETILEIGDTKPDIAIIGIACRLPNKITEISELWNLLYNSGNSVGKIPYNRWENELFYSKSGTSGIYTNMGNFIEGVELFDIENVKISPSELNYIDPQQRLMVEISFLSIKNSGVEVNTLSKSTTGVYIGCSSNDWPIITNMASILPGPFTGTGISPSIISNRVSYTFGFQGPSFTIDSACSSSLVAVDSAVVKLNNNEIEYAIVGGVNLLLAPQSFMACCGANMLSKDGICRTFDNEANGYGRGEGSISLLLTNLTNAKKNKSNIIGIVKSTSINQDGRSAIITAPNGPSQQKVIKHAISKANIYPSQIKYIETHGTGTKLGDPIEFNALKAVFNSENGDLASAIFLNRYNPLYIGAIKANIGHLEGAAGIAGLLKLLLVMNYGIAVPIPNLTNINPFIETKDFNVIFPNKAEIMATNEDSNSIFGGVSSFGFGGTNAHVIIECNLENSLKNIEFFNKKRIYSRHENFCWADTKHPLISEKILIYDNEKNDKEKEQLLFRRINEKTSKSTQFILEFNDEVKYLFSDHIIDKKIIWPAAAYLDSIFAAARHIFICNNNQISFSKRKLKITLTNIVFEQPLIINKNDKIQLFSDIDSRTNEFRISSEIIREKNTYKYTHVTGKIAETENRDYLGNNLTFSELKKNIENEIDVSNIYKELNEMGISYGNKFKTIQKAWRLKSETECMAKISIITNQNVHLDDSTNLFSSLNLIDYNYIFHPRMMDVPFGFHFQSQK